MSIWINDAKCDIFSCPGQLNRWHYPSLSEWVSCGRHMCPFWQLRRRRRIYWERLSDTVDCSWQIEVSVIMTLSVSSDWQSESDLDSVRNSCDDILHIFPTLHGLAGAFDNVSMITTTLPADRWNGSAKHTKAQHPKDIFRARIQRFWVYVSRWTYG